MTNVPTPGLAHAFTVYAQLHPVLELGESGGVRKRIIPVAGGRVEGPRLQGEVLDGGADWQEVRPDGTAIIFARYTLKATDGTLISVINPGIRRAPPEVTARLMRGERVDFSEYYFRTTPTFEVRDGPHDWLTRSIFICVGVRNPDDVEIRYFEVL